MNKIIQVRDVNKSFGGVVANRNISMDVEEGKITGLIGPNGSGKTTLFNSGTIHFNNREISQLKVQKIARLGILRTFQQTRIYSKMNCVKNMLISAAHHNTKWLDMFTQYPQELTERAEHLLEFVGLFIWSAKTAGICYGPDE